MFDIKRFTILCIRYVIVQSIARLIIFINLASKFLALKTEKL